LIWGLGIGDWGLGNRRGGKRSLNADNLDKDLDNYWKGNGKDVEKSEICK
jgi:hypothetical protein